MIDYRRERWLFTRTQGTCLLPTLLDGSSVITSNDPIVFREPPPIAMICLKRPIAVRKNSKVVGLRQLIARVRSRETYLEASSNDPRRDTALEWENIEIVRPVVAIFHPDHPPFADGFIQRPETE